MPATTGTLESILLQLGKLLSPLEQLLGPDIFALLGVELPGPLYADAGLFTKLSAAATSAGAFAADVTKLEAAIAGGDTESIIADALPMIGHIASLVASLEAVGTELKTASSGLTPAEQQQLADVAANMAVRTLEYMIVGYLNANKPVLASFFSTVGIMDIEPMPDPGMDFSRTLLLPTIPRRFYIDRIPTLFSNPGQFLQQVFNWGAPNFDGQALLQRLQILLEAISIPAVIYQTAGKPPSLEAYLFALQADTNINPPGLTASLTLPGSLTYKQSFPLSTLWNATIDTDATFDAGLAVTLAPPFNLSFQPPTGNVSLTVDLGILAQHTDKSPIMLIGDTGGSGLQVQSISLAAGVVATLGTSGGSVQPTVQLSIDGGKLMIDFSQGDGFIQKILSGVNLDADFSLQGTWDPKNGLRFSGQAGVEIFIPLHLDLSVIIINGLYFSLGFTSEVPLQIGLATGLTANLGPLVATVDQIGVNINITFPPGGKGRMGMADIGFAFAPPKGIGLSINTGLITGAGYLYINTAEGEYYGALELEFADLFSLKAVGLINTKMPDGSNGFSLLIIISADFTPIQLGFGFSLTGVGGLLGLNRTMDIDALQLGIKTDAIQSILFPQNVVANIDKIISDIKQIFPVYEGHFIVGPMGELGWETFITLELGILIEIPDPKIALVGIFTVALPDPDTALMKIQINFLGVLDFPDDLISFDASLYDSYILLYTLTGDMAFRLCWGANPYFIVSVGGFNPAFKDAPPDLQNMARLGIQLYNTPVVQVNATCYFAVTSNTVQFGAEVQLYAGAGDFNVYGYLGFDVLFQFDPFFFEVDIYAGLGLRAGGSVIMSITLSGQLSGPTPWNIQGSASFSILFFSFSVNFNETWGQSATIQLQQTIDVTALLVTAINDTSNWKAVIPDNNSQHVSIKQINNSAGEMVIHPFGLLTFSQRIVPLGIDIVKFGNAVPQGASNFQIVDSDPGDQTTVVQDQFAPASFFNLTDDQKISNPSFESMNSGFTLTSSATLQAPLCVSEDVDYRLSYLRKKTNTLEDAGIYKYAKSYFQSNLKAAAVSRSALSFANNRISVNAPDTVAVTAGSYAIAGTADMKLYGPSMIATSFTEARAMYNQLLQSQPALKGQIQIVSDYELNPN